MTQYLISASFKNRDRNRIDFSTSFFSIWWSAISNFFFLLSSVYRIKDKKKSKKIKIDALINFFLSYFHAQTHFLIDISIKKMFFAAEFLISEFADSDFFVFDSDFFFESRFDSNSSFIKFFNLVRIVHRNLALFLIKTPLNFLIFRRCSDFSIQTYHSTNFR